MKIGILGLRPRQINDIRGRGFNGDLYFHEDKAMSPASVSSFQRDKDLLFVQVHGMPKSAVQAVTTGKNCYLNAGSSVSSLIRMIEGAFADLDQEAYRKNNSSPAPKSEPVVVAPVVEAEPAVVHLLEMIEPNVDGTHNYSVITTGVVGQVFRFRQPSKLTQPVWRQRIHSMRSYQKAKGFVVSVEFADGYVDVTVDKTPVQEAKPVVTEVVDTPVVQAPVVEIAAKPEAETPVSTPSHSVDLKASETAKKFWCEAYLDATDRGETAEYAGLIADEAFEQYKLRFGS